MTEADLLAAVTEALGWARWVWHHETDSRRSRPGWPDLHACHAPTGRFLHVELKTGKGKLTDAQKLWVGSLAACHAGNPRGLVGVLRPGRLDDVLRWAADRTGSSPAPSLPLL